MSSSPAALPPLAALIDARYGAATGIGAGIADNPMLARILDRRVQRRYRAEPVPDELLDTLLACAQSAPTKSDLQGYSIIVWRDRAKIAQVADWIGTMPWIKDAPVFLLFCADVRRNRLLCESHGMPHGNDNLDTFLNTAVDAALALAHFSLAADAAGLGTCPISYVRNHLAGIRELAGLPDGVYPIAGLTLGWPEGRRPYASMRLPQGVVVHRERYDESGMMAAVAAYDAGRARREPLRADGLKNMKTYGPKEGCTWSENMARQESLPERADFAAWLRANGWGLK